MGLRIPAVLHTPRVDNDTHRLLTEMAATHAPPLYEQPVAQARQALKAVTARYDLAPLEVAAVMEHRITGNNDYAVPVRIYQPHVKAGTQANPLVYFHGGGWALGDLDTHHNLCRYLCARAGRLVISVDYRLAPEHPFPAGLQDCLTVLGWLPGNLHTLTAKYNDLVVMGDSAGGNLAAVVSQIARSDPDINIDRQILLYPSVDMNDSDRYPSRDLFGGGEYFLGLADVAWLKGMYLSDSAAPLDARISPIHAQDLSDLPRALVITAGYDLLRDEGIEYAHRLDQAGNQVEYANFPGTIHGFCSFAGALSAGQTALDQVCNWLLA